MRRAALVRVLIVASLFLLFSCVLSHKAKAHEEPAGDFDRWMTKALAWDDVELAGEISDYTMYASVLYPVGYAISKRDNRWRNLAIVGGTTAFTAFLTQTTKLLVDRKRPNGYNYHSFFSGHTSAAFTGAGLTCWQSKKACPVALAIAGATGYLRVAAKWHWATDVMIGAGVGYLNGRFIPTAVVRW